MKLRYSNQDLFRKPPSEGMDITTSASGWKLGRGWGWTGLLLGCALMTFAWSGLGDTRPAATQGAAQARFAVISDLHFFDTRLGSSGEAFETYLAQDPKLLRESAAILDSALQDIVRQRVKFVLVPGDLTKDGEVLNHIQVTHRLAWLERQGIEVFVVPGNHDISNPDARAFLGATTRPVPSASPAVFRALYQRFGYGQAIARDPHSLSYVAEPARGLRLLAIDACKYEENGEAPVVSGRIKPETLAWVLRQVQLARASGKEVIALMHHGVNQHFLGQAQIFPDYLVDDWPIVSAQLAAAGLKVIFTGHYHSQDAAYPLDATGTPQATLCDIQTGSLAGYPCSYRVATLRDSVLRVESRKITEIDADTGGVPFQDYAENFLRERMHGIVVYQLMSMFDVPQQQAAAVAPLVVDALIANYAGDEEMTPGLQTVLQGWMAGPEPFHTLGMMLWGIWTDLPPGDNELVVPLGD